MTPALVPVVRYLIVCQNVHRDPQDAARITLVTLLSSIRSHLDPPFPLTVPEFCVYLQVTGCRAPGSGCIEVVQADSEDVAFQSPNQPLAFGSDPLRIYHLTFRVRDCVFRQDGLYWVRFRYNEEVIAQQPLLLR